MVSLVQRPRDEVMLDMPATAIRLAATLAPRLTSWGLGRFVELYARLAERAPSTKGAVSDAAPAPGAVQGGLRSTPLRVAAAVTLGAGGLVLVSSMVRRRR